MLARYDIVAAARRWIGTPYHHQASLRGVGCDCLGLVRGVWRELEGPEPEKLPAYTRDWGDATGTELLMQAGRRHLVKLDDVARAQPGDVLVFRMRAGVAKHAGIFSTRSSSVALERDGSMSALPSFGLCERGFFIHAREEVGVAEVSLTRWWRRRVVAAFSFPGVA